MDLDQSIRNLAGEVLGSEDIGSLDKLRMPRLLQLMRQNYRSLELDLSRSRAKLRQERAEREALSEQRRAELATVQQLFHVEREPPRSLSEVQLMKLRLQLLACCRCVLRTAARLPDTQSTC